MSRHLKEYDYIAWKDEGIWTAHCPSIPGVYGLGNTKAQAERDLFQAVDTLFDYLSEQGEPPPKPKRIESGTLTVGI